MIYMNNLAFNYSLVKEEATRRDLTISFSDMFNRKYSLYLRCCLEYESLKKHKKGKLHQFIKNCFKMSHFTLFDI